MLRCHFFLNYFSILEGSRLSIFQNLLYRIRFNTSFKIQMTENSTWDFSQLSEPAVKEENETRQYCIRQMYLILHAHLPVHMYLSIHFSAILTCFPDAVVVEKVIH